MMTLRAGFGKLVGAALAGSLLVVAAPAAAQPCHQHHHPGGNSEVSAYVESVPGPCGNQGIGGGSGHNAGGGNGSGSNSSSALPSSATQGLQQLGDLGAAAARFAESTAPGGIGHGGGNQSGSGKNGGGGASHAGSGAAGTGGSIDTGDGSLTGALSSLITGGSDQGMGPLLPILLGAILMGGFAILALRRRYTQ